MCIHCNEIIEIFLRITGIYCYKIAPNKPLLPDSIRLGEAGDKWTLGRAAASGLLLSVWDKILAGTLCSNWVKYKAATLLSFLWWGDFPAHTRAEKILSLREGPVEGRDASPWYVLTTSQQPSCWNPLWLRDACIHQGRPWVKTKHGHKQDDWPEKTWKATPGINNLSLLDTTYSMSLPVCSSTHIVLLINSVSVSPFLLFLLSSFSKEDKDWDFLASELILAPSTCGYYPPVLTSWADRIGQKQYAQLDHGLKKAQNFCSLAVTRFHTGKPNPASSWTARHVKREYRRQKTSLKKERPIQHPFVPASWDEIPDICVSSSWMLQTQSTASADCKHMCFPSWYHMEQRYAD